MIVSVLFYFLSLISGNTECEDMLFNMPQFQMETIFEDEKYKEIDINELYNLRKISEPINLYETDYDQHLLNAALFYLTNEYRSKKKIPTLKFEKRLRNASFIHASEMMNRNFFNHMNPTKEKLRSPKDRCAFCNYSYKASAENIARTTLTIENQITYIQLAKKILDNLVSSPVHAQNILSKDYTELGCTIIISTKTYKGGEKDIYAVQDFGDPKMESLDLER